MRILSTLSSHYEENQSVIIDIPNKIQPVRSVDIFFAVDVSNVLSTQLNCELFETPWRPYDTVMKWEWPNI